MTSSDRSIPIVFLHGFAGSTERTWREPGWFELVHEGGRRPLGIDLLGHGNASKPHDPEAYSELTDLVIAELPTGVPADPPTQQVDLCGYSLGARTALEVAVRHPGLVRKLVMGGVGENLIGTIARSAPEAVDGDLGVDNVGYRFRGLVSQSGNDPIALAALSSYRSRRLDSETFTDTALGRVTAKCLIVIGDKDFVGRPEPLAQKLSDVTTVILPGVDHFGLPKHFGFIDAALEFLGAVSSW